MANKFRGEAELNFTRMIDGVEKEAKFKLVFDANAFCEIEDLTGLNMGEMAAAMEDLHKLSFKTIRAIILGGLKRHHEELQLKDAGDIISDAGLEATVEAMTEAFSGAMKELDAAPGEAKKKGRKKR
jgi:stress response protein SCP2